MPGLRDEDWAARENKGTSWGNENNHYIVIRVFVTLLYISGKTHQIITLHCLILLCKLQLNKAHLKNNP